MVKYCYLCHKTSNKSISLHKFPLDDENRSRWIEICNLDKTDDVTTIKLCSHHFTPDDFIEPKAKELGGRMVLKSGAHPSRSVPNPIKTIEENAQESEDEGDKIDVIIESAGEIFSNYDIIENDIEILDNSTDTMNVHVVTIPEYESNFDDFEKLDTKSITTNKGRFVQSHYTGRMSCFNVPSGRLAEINLNIAKETIQKKNHVIRTLQQKNRRLMKRVDFLQDLVKNLKRKKV